MSVELLSGGGGGGGGPTVFLLGVHDYLGITLVIVPALCIALVLAISTCLRKRGPAEVLSQVSPFLFCASLAQTCVFLSDVGAAAVGALDSAVDEGPSMMATMVGDPATATGIPPGRELLVLFLVAASFLGLSYFLQLLMSIPLAQAVFIDNPSWVIDRGCAFLSCTLASGFLCGNAGSLRILSGHAEGRACMSGGAPSGQHEAYSVPASAVASAPATTVTPSVGGGVQFGRESRRFYQLSVVLYACLHVVPQTVLALALVALIARGRVPAIAAAYPEVPVWLACCLVNHMAVVVACAGGFLLDWPGGLGSARSEAHGSSGLGCQSSERGSSLHLDQFGSRENLLLPGGTAGDPLGRLLLATSGSALFPLGSSSSAALLSGGGGTGSGQLASASGSASIYKGRFSAGSAHDSSDLGGSGAIYSSGAFLMETFLAGAPGTRISDLSAAAATAAAAAALAAVSSCPPPARPDCCDPTCALCGSSSDASRIGRPGAPGWWSGRRSIGLAAGVPPSEGASTDATATVSGRAHASGWLDDPEAGRPAGELPLGGARPGEVAAPLSEVQFLRLAGASPAGAIPPGSSVKILAPAAVPSIDEESVPLTGDEADSEFTASESLSSLSLSEL
ncbi:hypothetical protein H696_01637 [Fonticula alba]|uniref:Uncharacterized protein n=1 Tax=Fonticula alba TaxID=691883 RepID=A0A058ZE60_FONAL|nr:hypothetical protein H696_01637 [Fonticula alba]KCV72236.1 hypothetical protein H696_01637 [Fonticula alba]|eukprot:XP_009493814.1 hypothetical protein H696_01637 [Fonticula alba]